MVATVTAQKIADGPQRAVIKATILGDGAGDIAAGGNVFLVDPATLNTTAGQLAAPTRVRVDRVQACLSGFTATLFWDATSDVQFMSIPDSKDMDEDFTNIGGLSPTGAAGQTGKIQITTSGLATGETGFIILHLTKKP